MAAESLLPLFYENPAGRMADLPNEEGDILADLLGGAGDDLLASLLEPSSVYLGQLSPPLSRPPFPSPPHSTNTAAHTTHPAASYTLLASGSEPMAHSSLPSPTNDGYVSDGSSLNRAHSPYSDIRGNSASPGDVMVTSSSVLPVDELDALLGSLTSGSSSEVKIDVDSGLGNSGVQAAPNVVSADSWPASGSLKAATLVLTEEEKQLLAVEGLSLPTDMPLTKQEQKHLKRVRRKIKNKLSAQESRKRKKEYVEGLEERVQCCTNTNNRLRERVDNLETENKSLLEQLKKLRSLVAHIYPSKLQAGTILMVLSLCFSLTVFPWPHTSTPAYSSSYHSVTVHSRTLLFTETDEFGNIIDPDTGLIVSQYGGLTPKPPYPWSLQTPAFLSALTATLHPGHVTTTPSSHNPSLNSRQDL